MEVRNVPFFSTDFSSSQAGFVCSTVTLYSRHQVAAITKNIVSICILQCFVEVGLSVTVVPRAKVTIEDPLLPPLEECKECMSTHDVFQTTDR